MNVGNELDLSSIFASYSTFSNDENCVGQIIRIIQYISGYFDCPKLISSNKTINFNQFKIKFNQILNSKSFVTLYLVRFVIFFLVRMRANIAGVVHHFSTPIWSFTSQNHLKFIRIERKNNHFPWESAAFLNEP